MSIIYRTYYVYHILWLILLGITSYADTNIPEFVSTTQSNGVMYMTISAPTSRFIAMDYSFNLVEWHWLDYIVGEIGETSRIVFVTNGEGFAHIRHNMSSLDSNAFFRAILYENPSDHFSSVVPLKDMGFLTEPEHSADGVGR